MSHEHDIDGEFLVPSDGAIVDIRGSGDDLTLEVVLPCPECDQPLSVDFEQTGDLEEVDIDFPLDDAEAALD